MSKVAITGNASGTGTLTIAAPNTNTDRTLTLPDEAGTVLTSGSASILPNGGPAFYAVHSGADVSLTNSTWTKVILNHEDFDTDNCFDSSTNYRFTPTVPGYYKFEAQIQLNWATTQYGDTRVALYKNGTWYTGNRRDQANNNTYANYGSHTHSGLIPLNGTTDYVEMYIYTNAGTGVVYQTNTSLSRITGMTGFFVRSL